MRALTTRLLTLGWVLAVAGCGGTAGMVGAGGGRASPAVTSAPVSSTAKPSAVPTVDPATAAPLPPATRAPVSAPAPTPAAQPPAPVTFAIKPLFPGGAAGTVTVVRSPSGVHYHAVVTGLVPGSAHTIHDHAGTCGSASRSMHLAVLATAPADSHGIIVFDTTVPPFEFGAGRIVIVYDSAQPRLITGCATL